MTGSLGKLNADSANPATPATTLAVIGTSAALLCSYSPSLPRQTPR
jgi:hypothetical protein